ncbi:MAG: 23S rRNA (guanosine(2251)-2'-O)-methyltransferase RlmB [Anaerolineae bacterium]|nr:23S rRNA (guanosine(2251)-2'-O)-methyltransferase RlmB [Anaerolineae bacterium]MDW8172671.1 23S rRNA (guanosine(2251)-2'-O)-methyltransferase RlmB [Anaerolineae bacterium]
MPEFLYGHWPIMEALRANRRKLEQLIVAERQDKQEEKGLAAEILLAAKERGLPVQRVAKRILDDITDEANHQGMALRVGPYPYAEISDMLALAAERSEKPLLLILDLLKDPHNVGSLLRVADAVGVHGVILQDRRGVGVTSAVSASSSGAVEHQRVAQVTNLVAAMKQLKEENIWLVGLDVGQNIPPLDRVDLNMGLGLVLGSEGEGLRRLVRDTCDLLVTLPMRGKVGSLNVATAGSVALYAAWQARGWQGWAHA